MKIDIAFDIDEVMVRFMQPVSEVLKSRGYSYEETKSYNVISGVSPRLSIDERDEIFNLVYADPYSIPIVEGAQELCTKLYIKTGDPILFVTSRNTDVATETHILVKRFCKVPYILAFSDAAYAKFTFLDGISYFVEDRRDEILSLAGNNKTVFVPKRSWNDIEDPDDSIVYIGDIGELIKNINLFVK